MRWRLTSLAAALLLTACATGQDGGGPDPSTPLADRPDLTQPIAQLDARTGGFPQD